MPATPYGIILQPMNNFKTMLSKCSAFQAWCEETNENLPANEPTRSEACLDYIHLVKYDKPSGGFVYPAAIINIPEDSAYVSMGVGATHNDFSNGTGQFSCTLIREIPTAYATDDVGAWINFAGEIDGATKTGVGAILEQITELSMVGEYLWITRIQIEDGPWWLSEEKKAGAKALMGIRFSIDWGIE